MSLFATKRGEIMSETLLVEAARDGDLERVRQYVFEGVNVDAEDYNKSLFYASKNYLTPLQYSSQNGHAEIVEFLIENGADVNSKDRFDVSSLHMASEKGHLGCVRALLTAGADCSLPTKFSKSGCYTAVPHPGGTTPLHLAAQNRQVECVRELIQYGADYNAIDERGRTSLYIAAQYGYEECVLAHLRNAVGRDILSLPCFETSDTPLHFAVSRGMTECVSALLKSGSDVNHRNCLGCTPLHLAVTPTLENESNAMEILRLLVLDGYNTDVNMRSMALAGQPDGSESHTPLHYVCFTLRNSLRRRPEMAKFLIAHGASVHIKTTRGLSLLDWELKAQHEDEEILRYIVRSLLQLPHLRSLNMTSLQSAARASLQRNAVEQALRLRREHISPRQPQHYSFQELRNPYENNMGPPPMEELLPRLVNPPSPPAPVVTVRDLRRLQVYDPMETNGSMLRILFPEGNRGTQSIAYAICSKQLWYEQMCTNPRTLQHCCRFAIRSALGPMRMRHIRKLNMPTALQSYLLLEYGD